MCIWRKGADNSSLISVSSVSTQVAPDPWQGHIVTGVIKVEKFSRDEIVFFICASIAVIAFMSSLIVVSFHIHFISFFSIISILTAYFSFIFNIAFFI